jgi:hypothetical protein
MRRGGRTGAQSGRHRDRQPHTVAALRGQTGAEDPQNGDLNRSAPTRLRAIRDGGQSNWAIR